MLVLWLKVDIIMYFIADITDTITEAQKNHIYMRNKYYNNTNEN